MRNCLVALSETEEQERELYQLFQYRFNRGSLDGMSLGNLLMTALTDITGSFEQAIKTASRILHIRGKVLPSTLTDTHICADLEDGTYVEEEFNVRGLGKSPIKEAFLKNADAVAPPEAIEEILKADIVVIGRQPLYKPGNKHIGTGHQKCNPAKQGNEDLYMQHRYPTRPNGQVQCFQPHWHDYQIFRGRVLDYVLVNNNIPPQINP